MRRLAYRDRFTNYLSNLLSSDTTGDSIENDFQFGESGNHFLVLEVDKDSWLKLFSSVMTGSDLMYQDEAHEVTWLLWKAAKMGEFCEQIASCIDNSASVDEALLRWHRRNELGSGGGTPEEPLPEDVFTTGMLPNNYTCDNDHYFGMANAIVVAINEAVTEIFQAIEVALNPSELAAELADNFPIAGLVGSALEITDWVQESAYEAYEAAWSQAVQDNIACELFCAMSECNLTFDMIWDVYTNLEGVPPLPSVLDPWIVWANYFISLPLVGATQVVKIGGAMGLSAMRYGGSFSTLALGIRSIETTVQLAADETDNGWAVLCNCEGGIFTITFDTLVSSNWNMTFSNNPATIRASEPQTMFQGNPTPSCRAAFINAPPFQGISQFVEIELNEAHTLSEVSFQYYYIQPENNVLGRYIDVYDAIGGNLLGTLSLTGNDAPQGAWQTVTYEPVTPLAGSVYIVVSIGIVGTTMSQANTDGYIDNIRVVYDD